MGFSFRKSFGVGPFRTTFTHRGITNSVGFGGARYSKTKRYDDMGVARDQDPVQDLTSTGEGQPSATPKGNPIVGWIVIAAIAYVIYKVLT
jgi:hypothetical protein